MKYCPQCGSKLQTATIDARERLKCDTETCDYVFWDNPTPVVAAVVELDGDIVLVRQKGWPEKWHGLVAGFLEKNEMPEFGILRELKEELGLEGTIAEFIGHYNFSQRNQLILAFHVKAQGEIVLGEEIVAVKRVPPDKLRPWPIGTGPAVKDWLAARKASAPAVD